MFCGKRFVSFILIVAVLMCILVTAVSCNKNNDGFLDDKSELYYYYPVGHLFESQYGTMLYESNENSRVVLKMNCFSSSVFLNFTVSTAPYREFTERSIYIDENGVHSVLKIYVDGKLIENGIVPAPFDGETHIIEIDYGYIVSQGLSPQLAHISGFGGIVIK